MMKKDFIKIFFFLTVLIVGISLASSSVVAKDIASIKVTSSGINNGKIGEKYGMYGSVDKKGIPKVSIPIKITNAPKKTKYYAIYMYDNNVPWTHWMVVNYKSNNFKIDASRKNANSMIQGKNSFGTIGYGGPTPPDKTHTYTIKIYAIEKKVKLSNGFSYSQFNKAIKGKILSTATIKGKYVKK